MADLEILRGPSKLDILLALAEPIFEGGHKRTLAFATEQSLLRVAIRGLDLSGDLNDRNHFILRGTVISLMTKSSLKRCDEKDVCVGNFEMAYRTDSRKGKIRFLSKLTAQSHKNRPRP